MRVGTVGRLPQGEVPLCQGCKQKNQSLVTSAPTMLGASTGSSGGSPRFSGAFRRFGFFFTRARISIALTLPDQPSSCLTGSRISSHLDLTGRTLRKINVSGGAHRFTPKKGYDAMYRVCSEQPVCANQTISR